MEEARRLYIASISILEQILLDYQTQSGRAVLIEIDKEKDRRKHYVRKVEKGSFGSESAAP